MKYLILILLLFFVNNSYSFNILKIRLIQNETDAPCANFRIFIDSNNFAYTNAEGIATFKLDKKDINIQIYNDLQLVETKNIQLLNDTFITIILLKKEFTQSAFVVKDKSSIKLHPHRISISAETLEKTSLALSTNDPIQMLKLLPGVSTSQEMNSSISIRGANNYNTCFYLDNVHIPILSHSMGLFSFFDNNTIRNIDYFNSNISSEYGSRGSSYLKFSVKDPLINKNNSEVSFNPFFVSANFNLKIKKDKLGIFGNIRKSILSNEYSKTIPLFTNFYDILIKLKYKINERTNFNILYLENQDKSTTSFGFGLSIPDSVKWNFKAISSQINKVFKNGNNADISVFYKNQSQLNNTIIINQFEEYNFKAVIKKNKNIFLNLLGIETQYLINKNNFTTSNLFNSRQISNHIFCNNNFEIDILNFFANFRLSKIEPMKNLFLEKRVGVNINLNKKNSTYLEYNTFINSLQTLSNNIFPVNSDFKFLSSNKFNPLITEEYLIGNKYQSKKVDLDINLYYRNYKNAIDYKNINTTEIFTESNIKTISLTSYGIETVSNIKINTKNSIYLCYTYSRSFSKSDSINNGLIYPSNFDRPHNFNTMYSFKYKRLNLNLNFTLQSGRPITLPLFQAFGGVPIYSNRNEYRLKLYHRMDLGFQYHFKNNGKIKKFLKVNFYNLYFRKNIYAVLWAETDKTDYSFKYFTAFPFLPSFSFSIKF